MFILCSCSVNENVNFITFIERFNGEENILSISRSNIRFYGKQGLFSPERKDNNYREYTEQDIKVLKKIIV